MQRSALSVDVNANVCMEAQEQLQSQLSYLQIAVTIPHHTLVLLTSGALLQAEHKCHHMVCNTARTVHAHAGCAT